MRPQVASCSTGLLGKTTGNNSEAVIHDADPQEAQADRWRSGAEFRLIQKRASAPPQEANNL